MNDHSELFHEIFSHYPTGADTAAVELARDVGVPQNRARQWIRRGWLAPWYWPQLIDVLERKFQHIVSYRQLVEATVALRESGALERSRKSAETRAKNRTDEIEQSEVV
jgi:hypothetical protein